MTRLFRSVVVAHAPAWVLAVSIAVLGTALASQYFGGLQPCKLCIYQRWPYVVTIAAAIAALTLLRSPAGTRAMMAFSGLAFAVGGAIAVYHTGVEQGWFAGPTSCSGPETVAQTIEELRRQLFAVAVVRCDVVPWSLFGISMAGYNALASAAFAATSFVAVAMGAARAP